VRRSKTRLEKFKEMVNQSTSKHLSSLVSINVCMTGSREGVKSIQVSDSFSYMPEDFTKLRKKNKEDMKKVDAAVTTMKEKLRINGSQKSCILLPKIKPTETYGVRPAVYDFIYVMDGISEPKLEDFPSSFKFN
jgi:hypothetical protein